MYSLYYDDVAAASTGLCIVSVIVLLNYLNVSVLFYWQHVMVEVAGLLGRGLFCVCVWLSGCELCFSARGGGVV